MAGMARFIAPCVLLGVVLTLAGALVLAERGAPPAAAESFASGYTSMAALNDAIQADLRRYKAQLRGTYNPDDLDKMKIFFKGVQANGKVKLQMLQKVPPAVPYHRARRYLNAHAATWTNLTAYMNSCLENYYSARSPANKKLSDTFVDDTLDIKEMKKEQEQKEKQQEKKKK